DGLAHIERFQQRKLFPIAENQLGEALQDLLPFLGCEVRPCPLAERRACSAHRPVDVLSVTGGNTCEQLARAGVDGIESRTRGGLNVVAVDEGLRADIESASALVP